MSVEFQKSVLGVTYEYMDHVLDEYNLTKNDLSEGLKVLKYWYNQQPHFPEEPFDDDFWVRFYSTSKFKMEKTKDMIEKYLGARNMFPEFFKNRDPFDEKLINAMNCLAFVAFPIVSDKQRYRILYTAYKDKNPAEFEPYDFAKAAFMISEVRLKYEVILGDIHLWNLKHLQFGHITKVTPAFVKKMFFISQKCYGTPVKGIYIINMPSYAHNTVAILKKLLSKKLAERIQIFSSLEELHQYIDPDFLPIDLGGSKFTADEITESYFKEMQSPYWVNWFNDAEQKGIDELKKPEQLKNDIESDLGIIGSFRKIDID